MLEAAFKYEVYCMACLLNNTLTYEITHTLYQTNTKYTRYIK